MTNHERTNQILIDLASDIIKSPDLIYTALSVQDMQEVSILLFSITRLLDAKIQEHKHKKQLGDIYENEL